MKINSLALAQSFINTSQKYPNRQEIAKQFINYLQRKKLTKYLPAILRNIQAISDKNKLYIYSSFEIDREMQDIISEKFINKIQPVTPIETVNVIDASLIGGIRLVYQDQEIDMTISRQVNKLRSQNE